MACYFGNDAEGVADILGQLSLSLEALVDASAEAEHEFCTGCVLGDGLETRERAAKQLFQRGWKWSDTRVGSNHVVDFLDGSLARDDLASFCQLTFDSFDGCLGRVNGFECGGGCSSSGGGSSGGGGGSSRSRSGLLLLLLLLRCVFFFCFFSFRLSRTKSKAAIVQGVRDLTAALFSCDDWCTIGENEMKLSTSWKFWNFFRVQLEFLSGIGQRRLGWKRNGVDTIAVDGDDKVDLFFAGGCTSAHRVWLCLCVEDRGGKDEDEDDRMIAERMKRDEDEK